MKMNISYYYIYNNYTKMNSKLVLAVIVILLLLYVIFKALTTTYSTLGTMQKWTNKTTLQSSNLPSTFKANSAISIWFYIKKWVGGANVVTFHSGTSSSSGNTILRVLFKNNTNTIQICPRSGEGEGCDGLCEVTEFPLQKWVNLIISFNGSAMDVYVDGKLVKSCVVNLGSRIQETQSIILGDDGPKEDVGFITNVKLKAAPIAPQEAWDIYSQGFGGSPWSDLLNKYKVKLSFIVDNQEQASVST
jgi:hypothetical protein